MRNPKPGRPRTRCTEPLTRLLLVETPWRKERTNRERFPIRELPQDRDEIHPGCFNHPEYFSYFPMQKREKISPSRSSDVNSPVIDENASWAARSSSANSS